MLKILVVDRDKEAAMALVGSLGREGKAELVFVAHALRAINNLNNNSYDVIILGDKLEGGDTYDVGLEIKKSNKNKHAAIICIGHNVSRATKLTHLLRPYAQVLDVSDKDRVEVCVGHLLGHLERMENIRKRKSRK